MDQHTWFIIALVIYLLLMVYIGWTGWKKTAEYDEYMIGGRGLHPFVAALSAGASDMSGWLLMGLPGAIYLSGLNQTWIAIGLVAGAWLNWKFTAPRLRSYTKIARNSITVPSFLENRLHDTSKVLRVAAGLIILLFFTFYVSSGMVAGGRYWESTFGGNYLVGMLLVAAITVHRAADGSDCRHHLPNQQWQLRLGHLQLRCKRPLPGQRGTAGRDLLRSVRWHSANHDYRSARLGSGLLRPAAHYRSLYGSA